MGPNRDPATEKGPQARLLHKASERGFSTVCAAVGVWSLFFQAEDGIRDLTVTGVQTCALPIWGKRVQAMGGAKNHAIVMPDADLEQVANELMGAGYGSAGERCMAISVVVPVTEHLAESLLHKLKPRGEGLKVGPPTHEDAAHGPLITAAHRKKRAGHFHLGMKGSAQNPA